MGVVWETLRGRLPKWFRVIKWEGINQRFKERQAILVPAVYLPFFFCYFWIYNSDRIPFEIAIFRLHNEEDRLKLKSKVYSNPYFRDWELGQYQYNVAPLYDTWERRKKYPEYYGDKYNTFKRYIPQFGNAGFFKKEDE